MCYVGFGVNIIHPFLGCEDSKQAPGSWRYLHFSVLRFSWGTAQLGSLCPSVSELLQVMYKLSFGVFFNSMSGLELSTEIFSRKSVGGRRRRLLVMELWLEVK